ncbi:uncharacterized protein LOC132043675 [Lycium ferocissimum]|uniref:uncharacterized protein LOC132043675 n=1 Tax=Lycium ferocissimum TaxID=112874 RepID=UPI00281537B2|nr:uncharacterized protein LOC132043675 [Lycium ferocissimum]
MIDKALFWNIRSVNTQKSFERLIDLKRRHQYSIIGLMEPFLDPIAIEEYRRKLGYQNCKVNLLVSVVYAKCARDEREELWEAMVELANQQDLPWIIGGDFNVIVSDEEKQGGLPDSLGSKFTWWNGRTEEECIFKRLDRILVNQQVLDIMPSTAVTHLIRHGSDHAPLHLECNSNAHHIVKNTYGNIFQQIATIEDTIKVKELQFQNNASRENRMQLHQAQAELTRFLHLEEEYWKQKASMKWFNDGDRNTKFFHSYVRGRRNKLTLKRIQDPTVHGGK